MTTTNEQHNAIFSKRVRTDERLDALFMRNMRCPYCQTQMPKGTSKCKNCGLTKEQIYYAPLVNPYKSNQNVLHSKIRPAALPLWKMGVGVIFGFLGTHCYIAKRYVRGIVMLLLTVGFIISCVVFPPSMGETAAHEFRAMFESRTYLFPGDLLGIVVLGMWVWDLFAIFFGQFKYPVQPKIEEVA